MIPTYICREEKKRGEKGIGGWEGRGEKEEDRGRGEEEGGRGRGEGWKGRRRRVGGEKEEGGRGEEERMCFEYSGADS